MIWVDELHQGHISNSHILVRWALFRVDQTEPRSCVRTGRWARALSPYSTLPPSLISPVVSVDVKHHERRSVPVM